MTLSILQLNINADNFWSKLIPFLKNHTFDILHFQKVCGKDSFCGNIQCVRDCYEELQQKLGEIYSGELAIAQRFTSGPQSYIGNAIFYKKDFKLLHKKIVFLHERTEPFPEDTDNYEDAARNFLHLKLKIGEKEISFINAHLAWAKTIFEQPHQTKQGEILFEYLKNLEHPFVVTGDFNIEPGQPLIKKISALTKNLIHEYTIKNTLNERLHRARMLFPPGAAVDYIFVTPDIKVNKFEVLDKEDLSDHLPLVAEIEV